MRLQELLEHLLLDDDSLHEKEHKKRAEVAKDIEAKCYEMFDRCIKDQNYKAFAIRTFKKMLAVELCSYTAVSQEPEAMGTVLFSVCSGLCHAEHYHINHNSETEDAANARANNIH